MNGPIRRLRHAEALSAAVRKVAPQYPAIARQLNVAGEVELEVAIDEQGRVTGVRALTGNPLLTRPAVDALRQWKFKPASLEGESVSRPSRRSRLR